jgi:hypothetical protein
MAAKLRYFRSALIFATLSPILSALLFVQTLNSAPWQGAMPIVTDQVSVSLSNKFSNPGIQGLKENGDVFIGDGSALFHWDHSSTTLTRLLQVNDPIPNYPGSSANSVGNPLQLNAAGHAAIINTWALKDTKDPAGVFIYDGSTYSKIALTGEAVPGVADHVFSNFSFAVINQSDQVAFVAQFEPVGEYILGVFRGSPGNPVEKIATLQDIDDLTGTGYDNIILLGIDDSGNAAFLCPDNNNPGNNRVFIGSPSGVTQILASGESAPGTGSGSFFLQGTSANYFLNAGGDLAFFSQVYGDATVTQGIWIRSHLNVTQKVVANGDSTGTSLGGTFSGSFSFRGFNSTGKVLFSGNLSGATSNYGLFLKNAADPAQVVIYRSQTVPGRSEQFNSINVARLNDSDNVALNSSLTGGSTSSGWFLGSGTAAPVTIVLQGDSTPIGGTYGPMNSSVPRFSNSGQLVFGADLPGSNINGIFLWNGSTFQGIVNTDADLPSGANTTFRFAVQSASDDEVIFFARKTGGKDTIFTKSLHPGDETIRRIVGDGDLVAGGSMITAIFRPVINDNEEIVFTSSVLGGSIYHNPVLWISQPGENLQNLVMAGDSAPGSAGGTFSGFPSQARINNAGEVAFFGQIAGATANSNNGIFIASLAGGIQKVVRIGDASPAGGTFTSFNQTIWLNESGQVLFRATSQNGPVMTDGLFVGTATSGPVKLVATGDTINSANVNIIGGFSRINNAGQVAVYLNLSNAKGIFLVAEGSAPVTLVSEDDPTPMPGGTFMELDYSNQDPGLVINDSGQVAFWAVYYLPGGGPILNDYGTGFFLVSPGSSPVARLISGQALPGGNSYYASFPMVGGTALSESGELAMYVRSLDDAPDLPRYVIADKDGVLRNFAAAGGDANGTGGEFSRLFPAVFLNSSGQFFTYSMVADGTPKVGLFVNGYASADTTLLLHGGRFMVQVDWLTPTGSSGQGIQVPLTSDSGYFWFFENTNVELLVKILDGRAVNGHFWFFYGALTDVEYTITVTDTQTGAVKTYLGYQHYQTSSNDVNAFTDSGEGIAPLNHQAEEAKFAALMQSLGNGPPSKQESGSLYLYGNRFKVDVSWLTPTGSSGMGTEVPLTTDSGYFWFFENTNVELLVKTHNGCGVNGHYWFFYGALTDVEYTITVTDTETDEVKTYLGYQHYQTSSNDVNAFACP